MIDHVSIGVRDLAAATAFYTRLLAPLGLAKLAEKPGTVGFGKRYPEFWLNERPGRASAAGSGTHVCLRADSMEAVQAFYRAGLAGGAGDEGEPGVRPQYSERYYAAFVRDEDGNRVEAVTFTSDGVA